MTQPYDDSPADRADPTESFGDGRVDAAVARLEELPHRPVSEHVELFDDVHRRLRAALGDAGDDPADDRSA